MDHGSAAHHAASHSAPKTRVNALMAPHGIRGTKLPARTTVSSARQHSGRPRIPTLSRGCGCAWHDRRAVLARLEGNGHLNVLIKLAENGNHSIKRETAELRTANAGKFRIGDASKFFRVARRELALVENVDDLCGGNGARLLKICVGSSKVAIHVAAAAYQLQIVFFHFRASFNRLSRSRIRSTSICGVLIPDFDFFWNTWITQISASILMA